MRTQSYRPQYSPRQKVFAREEAAQLDNYGFSATRALQLATVE
jgi:hypothetical protein